MAHFKITWLKTKESETVNQSDCDTVAAYINCRFGANFNEEVAKVELVKAPDANKPLPEEPAVKPKKSK